MSDFEQLSLFDAASAMGRKGGKSTSPAKQAAARVNGRQGGRPLQVERNPDGFSVKGCNIIYHPKGQAGEYAKLATNPYRGCGHRCSYCYVPQVLRMTRPEFDSTATPRPDFITKLQRDAEKYQILGIDDQVMLSFTTDPFNPFDTSLTRPTIETLQEFGLAFSTLSKGGERSVPFLDLYRPDRDSYATTLTSVNNDFSLKWEPGAAPATERIFILKRFHDAGIFTWVSCEPTLSVEETLKVIKTTHRFVDLFKVGRANYIPATKEIDWHDFTLRVIDLMWELNQPHYIKKDLQEFLPEGYENPRYVRQHN